VMALEPGHVSPTNLGFDLPPSYQRTSGKDVWEVV
jgi:hypothetical protein